MSRRSGTETKTENSGTVKSSFVKQAAILAGAGILSRVLGFFLRIPLSNVIGDEGNGIYGDGYNIYNFFLILSSAGLPAAISKMVSERVALHKREEAHRIFIASLKCAAYIGFVGMIIMFTGAGFFSEAINNPRSYYTLVALAPTILIVAVMAVFRGYFQGLGSTTPTAVSQLIEQVFNVIFSIILMYAFMKITLPADNRFFNDKIALGAAGGQLGTGVGALTGLLFISGFYYIMRPLITKGIRTGRRQRRSNVLPDGMLIRELLRVSIPIIAGTAVFSFSNLVDTAIVKGRLIASGFTEAEAIAKYGIYNVKYVAVTTLPVSISAALATAVIPSLAASAVLKDKKAVREKMNSSLRIAMLIAVPAAVGLSVLADPIIHLIFKNAPDGAELLMYGSVSVVFLSLSQISTGMLQGVGKIHIPVIAAALGVAFKIPLNFILCAIPQLNIYGAVISTVVCYAISSSVNLYMVSKVTKTKPDFAAIFAKPVIAAAGMGICCFVVYYLCYYILPWNWLATLASVGVGIIAYFIFMLLMDGLDSRDLMLIPFGKKIADKIGKKQKIRERNT